MFPTPKSRRESNAPSNLPMHEGSVVSAREASSVDNLALASWSSRLSSPLAIKDCGLRIEKMPRGYHTVINDTVSERTSWGRVTVTWRRLEAVPSKSTI